MTTIETTDLDQETIQPDRFAGAFYPANPKELANTLQDLMDPNEPRFPNAPKAYIMPHAGYRFSGRTAGLVAKEMRGDVRRVIILSPSHRHGFYGIAQPTAQEFATPLGPIKVDQRAMRMASKLEYVRPLAAAFEKEHGIEVELPWIKEKFPIASIAPFVIGKATEREIADLLSRLWGDSRIVAVISTDLSHFFEVERQAELDLETAKNIELFDYEKITRDHACGWMPLRGFLHFASDLGMRATRVHLTNSATVTGDKSRVVGYGSWVVHEKDSAEFAEVDRQSLLSVAAHSIHHKLQDKPHAQIVDYRHGHILQSYMASFVTLEINGRLRGCIGSLRAHRPLVQDVFENAFKAAFSDGRFAPLRLDEFEHTDCEIAVLGHLHRLHYEDRDDLLQKLEAKKCGVILSFAQSRATYLPKVWEQFSNADEFLRALLRKAQLPDSFWSDDIQMHIYSTERFQKAKLGEAINWDPLASKMR